MENNQEIKPKGLAEYLNEDSSLKREMTYEEYNSSVKTGFDDSEVENAYKTYCKIISETGVKSKELTEYIDEDSSLERKATYEEFNGSVKTGFDDSGIENTYKTYRKVLDGQVKK